MCCNHGKVRLDTYPEPPQALRQLYVGDDPSAESFLENICQYNAALAFTSLGADVVSSINNGRGCISSNHRVGTLLLAPLSIDQRQPSYSTLSLHHGQQQVLREHLRLGARPRVP